MFGRIGRAKKAAALAACLVLLGGASANAEPIKLRWKFSTGRQSKYRLTQSVQMEMKLGEKPVNVTSTQTMDLSWAVESVDTDGVAEMTQTIDRIQVKIEGGPGGDTTYDSDSEEAPEGVAALMAPMLEAIINKPIKLKMSPLGQITDVILSEEMSERLKKAPGFGPMSDLFSEGALKQTMGAGTLQFAPNLVDKGDKWQSIATLPSPGVGKQETTTTFTYRGLVDRNGRKVAKIDAKNSIKLIESEDAPAKVSLDEQESDGVIYYDPLDSQIVELKSKNKMKVTLDAAGKKLAQTITNTTSMEPLSAAKASKAGKKTLKLESSSSSEQ